MIRRVIIISFSILVKVLPTYAQEGEKEHVREEIAQEESVKSISRIYLEPVVIFTDTTVYD